MFSFDTIKLHIGPECYDEMAQIIHMRLIIRVSLYFVWFIAQSRLS